MSVRVGAGRSACVCRWALLFSAVVPLLFCIGPAVAQVPLGERRTQVSDDGQQTMRYRLVQPPAQQEGELYPLIVFLHGAGERGTDNSKQVTQHIRGLRAATQSDEFASFLVAPQLPSGSTFWHPSQPYDLTLPIVETLVSELPIDPQRIYVTGLSLGGFGTMNYLATHPDVFAAGVPMSGGGPQHQADQASGTPSWFFHGDADGVVSVDASREMVAALQQEGGTPLFTEIYKEGHNIWGPLYDDWQQNHVGIYPWMFQQRLGIETETIIPFGDTWRYHDQGVDLGTAWRQPDYDDSAWAQGPAELGYGDGDEATVLDCGEDPDCRLGVPPTTYFRNQFDWDGSSDPASLEAQMRRDDLLAVYLNGTEVFRDARLPNEATFETVARQSLENAATGFTIDPALLRTGQNQIAVELHQRNGSRDLSFDLRLVARSVPEPNAAGLLGLGLVAIATLRRSRRRPV